MRDWNRAEMAARDAERAVYTGAHEDLDAVQSPVQRAAYLRRRADAILESILDDVRQHCPSFIPWINVVEAPAATHPS